MRHIPGFMMLAILSATGTAQAARQTLFDAMGGAPVLHTAMDRFVDIVLADDRINFTFAETDLDKFKGLLYEQLCQLSGGPCNYSGRDMQTAHAKLAIDDAQFNALAEDLYLALGKAGVSYRQQNRLMALLAPMRRDISKGRSNMKPPPVDDAKDPG
jgi:hemoglobin